MVDFYCPACVEDQDLQPLRDEAEDGFIFILWGDCGHGINLEDLEKSVEEQRKIPSRFIDRKTF